MTASKPFTMIAALLLLIVAGVHAYRLATGMAVEVQGSAVPMIASWIGVAVAALLAFMLLVEAKR
jgi:lipopolysaccharide export LptBFGC system permease protein LptF